MKNDKIRVVSFFIAFLLLFSITANAFTLFDDVSPSFGILSYDADDDIGHADEIPLAEVPAPLCAFLAPLHPAIPLLPSEAVTPLEVIPYLHHISRAPPLFIS